ncbi:hypothetical protein [Streptomyces sp. MBT53]|uniref:hypothetical protein n=1 Tax=Streptomyces sp. MBT53 TaxID=1488384 RepID=UPI001F316A08|nr:hypothetical protein [Streptomyces sp. MBT53]
MGDVLGVGFSFALDKDLVRTLDLVEGWAAVVVTGRAKEPERHVTLKLRMLGSQDA